MKQPPERIPGEDTRTKLLKAALPVFFEHGYEGATVREICRRARVNLALVNYHFGDKRALYMSVVHYAMDAEAKLALLERAVEQNTDPCEALRQIIHRVIQQLGETRPEFGLHLRFLLKEITTPNAAITSVLEKTMRPIYDRLRGVVGRILNLPIDHPKTRLCTHSIMGQVAHYAQARPLISHLWPEMQMSPQQSEMVADHIADFSLAYLRTAHKDRPARAGQSPPRRRK